MTQEVCPHCGASLKKYWHRLTPGLVQTLVKIYSGICSKQENIIQKDELTLTHSEYGNFQKLRFHGLIAKHKVDGKWNRRDWLITRRGADFLKGHIEVPYRVQTFRNQVVAHDAKKVGLKDVMGSGPYFEGYEEFRNQLEFMVFPTQNEPAVPSVRSIVKKGKKEFCSCGGRIQTKVIPLGVNEEGAMRVDRKKICQKCQFEFPGEI